MKNQSGFGLISTIIIFTLVATVGWIIFVRMTNLQQEESASEAIERAKTNVDKANEASSKVKEAADATSELIDKIDVE